MGIREELGIRRERRHKELRDYEQAGGLDTGSATLNTLAYGGVMLQDTVEAVRATITGEGRTTSTQDITEEGE